MRIKIKIKIMIARHKLVYWTVVTHSILIVLALGLSFLPSDNPDTSIAYGLMCIVGIIDFPITMLFEKIIRPIKPESYPLWVAMFFAWFTFIGALYWFCISMIVTTILRKLKENDEKIS